MSQAIETFKKNVHQILEHLGWTQTELARRAGMHKVQLGKYLTGNTEPSLEVIERIAAALQVVPEDLLFSANPYASQKHRLERKFDEASSSHETLKQIISELGEEEFKKQFPLIAPALAKTAYSMEMLKGQIQNAGLRAKSIPDARPEGDTASAMASVISAQQTEIEALKAEIQKLEAKNKALNGELATIEGIMGSIPPETMRAFASLPPSRRELAWQVALDALEFDGPEEALRLADEALAKLAHPEIAIAKPKKGEK